MAGAERLSGHYQTRRASRPNLPIAPLHRGVRVRLVRRENKKKTGKVPAITLRRCYQVGVARRAEPPGTIIIVMGREQHNERGPARPGPQHRPPRVYTKPHD